MSVNHVMIPESYRDLLERPLYGHLATIRPDGTPQVNPMWFVFDGQHLRFTHTTTRQKYRNLLHDPHLAMSVTDPDDQSRYLEVRGILVRVDTDPEGKFFAEMSSRYGGPGKPPADAPDRVILVVQLTGISTQ